MKADLNYFKEYFFGYRQERFPVTFTEQRHLESCEYCNGTGRKSRSELSDYHKREYDTIYEDCNICAGQGRLIVTDIHVSFGDIKYDQKVKSSNVNRILFETYKEPYTTERAANIERSMESVQFTFSIEDIKE